MVKSNTLTITVKEVAKECKITFRSFYDNTEFKVKVSLDGVEYETPFEKSLAWGSKHKLVAPSFVEPDKVFDSIVFRDIVSRNPEFEFTVPEVDATPLLIYYKIGAPPPAEIEVKVVNQTPSATVTVRAYSQGKAIGDYTLNPGDTKTVKAVPVVALTVVDTKNVSPGKIVVFKESNDYTVTFSESGTATLVEVEFTWPPGYVNVKVNNKTPATVRCVAESLTTGARWVFVLKPGESYSFRGDKTVRVSVGKYSGSSKNMKVVLGVGGKPLMYNPRSVDVNEDVELDLVEAPVRYGFYNPRVEDSGLNASLSLRGLSYDYTIGEYIFADASWSGWKYAKWVLECGGWRKEWKAGYLSSPWTIGEYQRDAAIDIVVNGRPSGTTRQRVELYNDSGYSELYGYTPWLVYDVNPEPGLDEYYFSAEVDAVKKYIDSVVVGGVEYVFHPIYGVGYIATFPDYAGVEQPHFKVGFEDLTREAGESPDYDYDEPRLEEVFYDVANRNKIRFKASYGGMKTTKLYYMDKLIYTFNPGTYTVEFEVPL
jgi:hypothetical protein